MKIKNLIKKHNLEIKRLSLIDKKYPNSEVLDNNVIFRIKNKLFNSLKEPNKMNYIFNSNIVPDNFFIVFDKSTGRGRDIYKIYTYKIEDKNFILTDIYDLSIIVANFYNYLEFKKMKLSHKDSILEVNNYANSEISKEISNAIIKFAIDTQYLNDKRYLKLGFYCTNKKLAKELKEKFEGLSLFI